METTFYAYTILVMLVCACASTASLLTYAVTQNKVHICVAIAFLLYFFDLTFIFQVEYLNHGNLLPIEDFYLIRDPILRAILAFGILESLWIAVCLYLSEKRTPFVVLPGVLFLVSEIAIVCLMQDGPLKQWWFYSMREAFLLFCLTYIAARYRSPLSSIPIRARIKRMRRTLLATLILVGCIVAENTFIILLWRPSEETMMSVLPIYFAERNFSENALVILLAVLTLRHAVVTFRLRHKRPPTPDGDDQERYVELILDLYCEKYALTGRERDVLLCIIEGNDYQNTASKLHLAVGTVKSHTHNILKKTGSKTRKDLIQDFWEN